MDIIENWVIFPEKVKLPIESCNLYEFYKLHPPASALIDEKIRQRLAPYLLPPKFDFDYTKIREHNIVMFLSINPKLQPGWSVEYGLFRATLETTAEESTGTWDPDLKTIIPEEMDPKSTVNMQKLPAKVIGLNNSTGMAAIALPMQGFEAGNLPMLLSVVIGNYTGMTSAVWGVRLEDLDFPDEYANSFSGPTIGNDGIKALLGDQISVGTIVKPKTGLSEEDWAKVALRSFRAGLDIVKDDENLTSQEYCGFDRRVSLVLKGIKKIKTETGREMIYVPNITHGDYNEMIRRGELIRQLGGNCLMLDILATGITAVQSIRKHFPDMILHGHRAGHGAQTIFPEIKINGILYEFRHGISMKSWTLIARLAGIDQFHIGAPKGKMEASSQTVLENLEACIRPLGRLKAMRPICSGGLKSTVMWDVARIMNTLGEKPYLDFIFQAGGGAHSHDLGTFGGSKSMVQARDAIQNGKSPLETISAHFETLLAFRKWEPSLYVEWLRTLTPLSKIMVDPDLRTYRKQPHSAEIPPAAVSLQAAALKYPPLLADLKKHNPIL